QSVRSAAAEALGKIGSSSEPVVAVLHDGLADGNPFVRLDSAAALWKINSNITDTVPVLIAILDSPASERKRSLRPAAAELLGEMGTNGRPAVPALTRALSFRRGDARDEAAIALRKICAPARSAIPALVKALEEDEPFFRWKVAETIAI